MPLTKVLQNIQKQITNKELKNKTETDLKQDIWGILNELHWPTTAVKNEYTLSTGGRPDFAFIDPNNQEPLVFIELKRYGLTGRKKSKEQVKGYYLDSEVPLIVLTDVKTWMFYYKGELAFETGFSSQPSIRKLSEQIKGYLEEVRIYRREVYDFAEEAINEKKALAEARKKIPAAWREIVKESNPLRNKLIKELREKAGHGLGVQLADDDVVAFLRSLKEPVFKSEGQDSSTPTQEIMVAKERKGRARGTRMGRSGEIVILGKSFPCKNLTDAMVIVFQELGRRESSFWQRFYNEPRNHGRTRRIIAQDARGPSGLYDSDNPRYEKAYKQLGGDWVIATYNNKKTIEKNISIAAEVAGLEFGRDIIINFDLLQISQGSDGGAKDVRSDTSNTVTTPPKPRDTMSVKYPGILVRGNKKPRSKGLPHELLQAFFTGENAGRKLTYEDAVRIGIEGGHDADRVKRQLGYYLLEHDYIRFREQAQGNEREKKSEKPRHPRAGELVILGRSYLYRTQSKAMAIVFEKLQEEDPKFLQRFYEHPENKKSKGRRRYLGRNQQELFGDNVKKPRSSAEIGGDWVVSADYNWSKKQEIIRFAAEGVAGLKFGEDIIINLDDSLRRQGRQDSPPPSPTNNSSKGEKRKGRRKPGGRSEMLVILGKSFPCKDFTDAMVTVFQELERRELGFYQRFYNDSRNHRKTRRIIAQDVRGLYETANPLYEKAYKQLSGDWIIATYNSKQTIERNIRKAAEVAGLEVGKDIIINFDA